MLTCIGQYFPDGTGYVANPKQYYMNQPTSKKIPTSNLFLSLRHIFWNSFYICTVINCTSCYCLRCCLTFYNPLS